MINKYNNTPVEQDRYIFDSKAECNYYHILKMRETAGEINHLRIHPVYVLQPPYRIGKLTIRAITYEADFEYSEDGGQTYIIEDVKGVETQIFKIKRKLLEYHYKPPLYVFRLVNA